jgi:hypothetical protein
MTGSGALEPVVSVLSAPIIPLQYKAHAAGTRSATHGRSSFVGVSNGTYTIFCLASVLTHLIGFFVSLTNGKRKSPLQLLDGRRQMITRTHDRCSAT